MWCGTNYRRRGGGSVRPPRMPDGVFRTVAILPGAAECAETVRAVVASEDDRAELDAQRRYAPLFAFLQTLLECGYEFVLFHHDIVTFDKFFVHRSPQSHVR